MNGPRGRFLTFEGIDGAGKSTHLQWFAERLRATGREVVVTREPGGTAAGERLREVLLHQDMAPDTEALVMFAARRQSVIDVIEPALAAGRWVLSDRFTDATFAYQGGGKGVPAARLEVLERWVQQGLQPDRTYLFDIDPERALARLADGRSLDKFERAGVGFFKRVRAAYLERARLDPRRFFVLDAELGVQEVQKELEVSLKTL